MKKLIIASALLLIALPASAEPLKRLSGPNPGKKIPGSTRIEKTCINTNRGNWCVEYPDTHDGNFIPVPLTKQECHTIRGQYRSDGSCTATADNGRWVELNNPKYAK